MIRFYFKKGLRFCDGKARWTLLSKTVNGKYILENDEGIRLAEAPKTVHEKWLKNEWVIEEGSIGQTDLFFFVTPKELDLYNEKQQKIARYRFNYLQKLEEKGAIWTHASLPILLKEIAGEINDKTPPSASTVLRWFYRFRGTKCITTLIGRDCHKGRNKIGGAVYTLFLDIINARYLDKQKCSKQEIYEELELKTLRSKNAPQPLKLPGKSTVYRWFSELEQDIVDKARLGKDTADMKHRTSIKTVKVRYVLDRVEIDHTVVNVIVIDKSVNLPCGRPWITLAIDKKSRMILGFHITFRAPSSNSVMQCLKHAILPKDTWLNKFEGIRSDWPAQGIPAEIVWDNGMDLHSDAVRQQCKDVGINSIDFCPRKTPWWKATIERINRTIAESLFHTIPGTTFSNILQRGEYDSVKNACIDINDLVYLVTKWIVDVYQHTPHREMGTTPYKKWNQGTTDRIIELPAYPDQLEMMVGIPINRKLWHYGFEIEGLYYNSEYIQELRLTSGKNIDVFVKYHEDTIEYIHALDPRINEYVRVDVVERRLDYAKDLTRHMHRIIREKMQAENKDPDDRIALLEAKEEIQQIIQKAMTDKRMAQRKKAKVVQFRDNEEVASKREEALTKATSELASAKALQREELDPGLDDDLPSYPTKKIANL